MGTPCTNGGLRRALQSQLGRAAERSQGLEKPCPSFLFKQLCVCQSCDLRDPFGLCISGLSVHQILFIRQSYPRLWGAGEGWLDRGRTMHCVEHLAKRG